MIIYSYIRRLCLLIIVAVIAQLSTFSQTLAAEVEKLLFEKESPYQTIYVTQHDSLVNLRAGSKYARSSAYDKDNPFRHVFEYTGLMVMGLSYLDNPQNALVIGLGGGTLTKYLKKYYPDLAIDNVEMDPVVVDAAREYFDFTESRDNQVFVMDGRRFLRKNDRKYDLGQTGFEELDLAEMALSTLDRELAWPDDTPLLTDDFAPVNLLRDPRQSSIN
jgi:predicted membrane-bound spermidine synthase